MYKTAHCRTNTHVSKYFSLCKHWLQVIREVLIHRWFCICTVFHFPKKLIGQLRVVHRHALVVEGDGTNNHVEGDSTNNNVEADDTTEGFSIQVEGYGNAGRDDGGGTPDKIEGSMSTSISAVRRSRNSSKVFDTEMVALK